MTLNHQGLSRKLLYGWPSPLSLQEPPLPQSKVDGDPNPGLKFSIVIPTLNQGDTIEDTIFSIGKPKTQFLQIFVFGFFV